MGSTLLIILSQHFLQIVPDGLAICGMVEEAGGMLGRNQWNMVIHIAIAPESGYGSRGAQ